MGPARRAAGRDRPGQGWGGARRGRGLREAGQAWEGIAGVCGAHAGEGLRLAGGRPLLQLVTRLRRERGLQLPITPPRRATSVSALCLRSRPAAWRLLPSPRTLFLVIILYACTTPNGSQSSLRLEPHDGPEWLTGRGLHHHFDGEETEPGKGVERVLTCLRPNWLRACFWCGLQNRKALPSGRM